MDIGLGSQAVNSSASELKLWNLVVDRVCIYRHIPTTETRPDYSFRPPPCGPSVALLWPSDAQCFVENLSKIHYSDLQAEPWRLSIATNGLVATIAILGQAEDTLGLARGANRTGSTGSIA